MSKDQKEDTLKQKRDNNSERPASKQAAKRKRALPETPANRTKSSGDTYVRNLLIIAAVVVIGALLSMIFAYIFGVIDFDQTRATTIDEFTVARASAIVETEKSASTFSQLAIAQIGQGLFVEAESTIQEGFALEDPEEERHEGLRFAHAMLAEEQGQTDLAIERYEETMRILRETFERVLQEDVEPNWALAFGLHSNYYHSAIALSLIHRDMGDLEKQIEFLNIAAEGYPTNADIFVWRGQANLMQGNIEEAISDFNEALRFIPDDADALAGLAAAEGESPTENEVSDEGESNDGE